MGSGDLVEGTVVGKLAVSGTWAPGNSETRGDAPINIKKLDSSSLYVASVVLPVPPFFRLATTPHVRRQPTDVFVAQISHQEYRRERNTGHGDFEFSILAGQAAETLGGRDFGRRCFLASAALPCRQGALPVCAFDAVCPAGKGAAEWRAGFLACRERKQAPERFAHQVILPARRGTGLSRVSPPGMELYTIPQTEHALSRHSFHIIRARQTRRFTRHVSLPSLFVPSIRRMRPGLPSPQNPGFSPFPPPTYSPAIPQGDRRALPAPAQGSRPLRIPFGGTAASFPVSASPNRRRRQVPARGLAAV